MEILWHGKTCFTLKGNSATVLIDPYNEKIAKQAQADLMTLSKQVDEKAKTALAGDLGVRVFDWPGEYEFKEVFLIGMKNKTPDDSTIFHVDMDGFKLCHLGVLKEKLSEETIEALEGVDILLVPIGGGEGINHKVAHEVIEQIDPRIVIPMNYRVDDMEDEGLAGVEGFLKEVGSHQEPQKSLKLKNRTELPEETTMFVVLEAQT